MGFRFWARRGGGENGKECELRMRKKARVKEGI